MAKDPKIKVIISADATKLNKTFAKIEKKGGGLKSALSSIPTPLTIGLGLLATAAIAGVKAFSDFEDQFTNVVTLLDQGSFKAGSLEEGINSLKDGVLALGAETGESFEKLNKGLFDVVSAGVPAEEAIATLSIAVDLAKAGATDTATAVDGLTSAMNAFGLDASQAQVVAEKFFTAQKFGKTTIEELSNNFGKAGATAAAFGVSLDELLGAVAAVTLGGIKTEAAFTGLNAIMTNISKPTKAAADEAKRLGIEFNSAELRSKGLKGFLDQLTESQGFNSASLEKLFGSVEAYKVASTLAGSSAEAFESTLKALGDEQESAATFQDALTVKQATAKQSFDTLKRSLEALLIVMGDLLAPVFIFYFDTYSKAILGVVKALLAAPKAISDFVSATTSMFSGWAQDLASVFNSNIKNQADLTAATKQQTEAQSEAIEEAKERQIKAIKEAEEKQAKILEEAAKKRAEEAEAEADRKRVAREEEAKEAQKLADKLAKIAAGESRQIEEDNAGLVQAEKDTEAMLQQQFEKSVEGRKLALQDSRITLQEIRDDAEVEKERKQIESDNRFLRDQEKFGTAFAELQRFTQSAGVRAAKDISGDLAALQNSENQTLQNIGKAAAVVNIGISTVESSMKAFAGLAWIPLVGPGLGLAAATALGIYGAEQIRKVNQMASGGLVPDAAGGKRDRVPALLEPGEFVIPRVMVREMMGDKGLSSFRQFADGGSVGADGGKGPSDLINSFFGMIPDPFKLIQALLKGKRPKFGILSPLNKISGIGPLPEKLLNEILTSLPAVAKKLLEGTTKLLLGPVGELLTGGVEGLKGKLKIPGFASGGFVPGSPGMGIDSVPAFLTPGEFVVPRPVVDSILDSDGGSSSQEIVISFKGDAGDFITAQQLQNNRNGSGR